MKPAEVLGPIGVALLAVGILIVFDVGLPDLSREPEPSDAGSGWLFDRLASPPDGGWAYALEPATATSPCGNATSRPWQAGVHRLAVAPGCSYAWDNVTIDVVHPFGRAVGPGNWTVYATAFVFTEDGKLVATTAPTSSLERFRLHTDFSRFNPGPWYLGEGATPNGTKSLGEWTGFVRDALLGAREGEVRGASLVEHKHDWYLGPVHAVARVDAVRPAD